MTLLLRCFSVILRKSGITREKKQFRKSENTNACVGANYDVIAPPSGKIEKRSREERIWWNLKIHFILKYFIHFPSPIHYLPLHKNNTFADVFGSIFKIKV